jgi:hypothetical protein
MQGCLGSCYALSSLDTLADQDPGVIKQAIQTNPNGTYTVRFFLDKNRPIYVVVTPDLPMRSGKPVFADSRSGAQWPMIMEKALAQLRGGYDKSEGFNPARMLFMLTGKRAETPSIRSVTVKMFADARSRRRGMVVSTLDNENAPLMKAGKLVDNHAYWVSGVDEKRGVITIRNPWGWDTPPIELTIKEFRQNFSQLAIQGR